MVQGKGTEDFVANILEPEVTGEFLLGYEEVNHPEWFDPHAGLDESGKGDLFGPVVCACVIADGEMVRGWMEQGIRDSKTITDGAIMKMAKSIASTKGVVIKTAFTGMEKYNELYLKFGGEPEQITGLVARASPEGRLGIKKTQVGTARSIHQAAIGSEICRGNGV